jgi:hypothetical protein
MSRMFQRFRARLTEWRQPSSSHATIQKRIHRIEKDLHALVEQHDEVFRLLRRLQAGVDGVVRGVYLDPSTLPYPERLLARRFRLHSQNQEDGLLWALFQQAGVTTARFVELGSGSSGGNAAMFAAECGWTGLMVEGDRDKAAYAARQFPRVTALCAWITPETVNDLLTQHGFTDEVDLFSLDIDGNDYWVWKAMTACSPRVVVLEYNSMFGPERAVTIPYDPKFSRHDHRFCYFGASLAALTRLSAKKGYRLVAVEPTGVNAFFLRNDIAPEIPACEPVRAYRLVEKYNTLIREKQIDVFKWADETGRRLVEVE